MEDSLITGGVPVLKRVLPYAAAVVVGGAGLVYAGHEHNNAQNLAAQNQQMAVQNQQMTAELNTTHSQLDALSAKVSALSTSLEPKPAPAPAARSAAAASGRVQRTGTRRSAAQDARFKKLQSQLDEQGKAISDTRNDLASARTELSGSIARTHDELVVLRKKGERNYYEFDLQKSKSSPFSFASGCTSQFKREGPVSLCLRKANTKHGYADLELMVDDRNLSQKHVNLYQPVMYYQPEMQQPVEIVINQIDKDHIHGYVSAPKYKPSELAATGAAPNPQSNSDQPSDSSAPPPARQKLPVPAPEPNQQ
jgi:hypothetical protein